MKIFITVLRNILSVYITIKCVALTWSDTVTPSKLNCSSTVRQIGWSFMCWRENQLFMHVFVLQLAQSAWSPFLMLMFRIHAADYGLHSFCHYNYSCLPNWELPHLWWVLRKKLVPLDSFLLSLQFLAPEYWIESFSTKEYWKKWTKTNSDQ